MQSGLAAVGKKDMAVKAPLDEHWSLLSQPPDVPGLQQHVSNMPTCIEAGVPILGTGNLSLGAGDQSSKCWEPTFSAGDPCLGTRSPHLGAGDPV